MIAIIDYGCGNLFSLARSLEFIGAESVVTSDTNVINSADRLLLPGVGAFGDAADKLRQSGLAEVVLAEAASGKPLLGVCVGMQLLFDKSLEYGEHAGLSLIPGTVSPIADMIPKDLAIPHIGWNALHFAKDRDRSAILRDISDGDCVYFVHSFAAVTPKEFVTATVEYGSELVASVERGNVFGCQFHPEKSGNVGLSILRAFLGV